MTFRPKFCFATVITSLTIISCGGGSGGGSNGGSVTPPPAADRTSPTVSFGSAPTTIESGSSVTINVTATDNVAVTSGPTVTCDNGGSFSGSTFAAPTVTYDAVSTCTASAGDAAGNTGRATLDINIDAPVDYVISKTSVFESELFEIEKISPAGTVEINQLSGPDVIVFRTATESVRFRAPSLDFDGTEQLSFEIVVTGPNNETASEVISAPEVIGRMGAGIPVAIYEPSLDLQTGFGSRTLGLNRMQGFNAVAIQQSRESGSANKVELTLFGGVTNSGNEQDYESVSNYQVEGLFDDVSYAEVRGLGVANGLAVLSKVENKLRWFNSGTASSPPYIYKEADSFTIEKPCFVRSLFGQSFVYVGQENNGLSIVELEFETSEGRPSSFNETIVQNIGGNRSLCYLFPTRLSSRLTNFGITSSEGIIAFDYKANDMVIFQEETNRPAHKEVEVIPLQTETSQTLDIIDIYSFGLPSRTPRSLGVLLSNKQNGGVHRFIHITQDDDDEINQKTYSWTGGIPVSLVVGNFGGDDDTVSFTEDVVVITDSNQSLFFESNATKPANSFERRNRSYAEPVFFETLEGAGSAVAVHQRSGLFGEVDITDVLVSYPGTGELRYYSPDSNVPKVQPPIE